MKLGQSAKSLYDNPTTKDDMIHPEMNLPAKLFDKAYKVGDKCTIELVGVIENMGKEQYRVKFLDGKEIETAKESAKEESLLKRAK